MIDTTAGVPVEILYVEDNPADVRLTLEALRENKVHNNLHVAVNGEEAMDFLHRRGKFEGAPRPDVIFLDLNLPKKDGREVLAEIKSNPDLTAIPIVVITSSKSEEDVVRSYRLHANCYVTKPLDLSQFLAVVRAVEGFWVNIVTLPPKG